jgi:hypothetical protein
MQYRSAGAAPKLQDYHAPLVKTWITICAVFSGAIACTGPALDIDLGSPPPGARFLLIKNADVECGEVGTMPAHGRVPPLGGERKREELLLELPAVSEFDDDEDLVAMKLKDVDPATLWTKVVPMPSPSRAWMLDVDGTARVIDPAEVMTGTMYLAERTCSDRVERACRGEVECPIDQIVMDEPVEGLSTAEDQSIASLGDAALVVSSSKMFLVQPTGVVQIDDEDHGPTVSDGLGGAFVFGHGGCLRHFGKSRELVDVACSSEAYFVPLVEYAMDLGADGRLWIASNTYVVSYKSGEWTWHLSDLDSGYSTKLELLDDSSYILIRYVVREARWAVLWSEANEVRELSVPDPGLMERWNDELWLKEESTQTVSRFGVSESLAQNRLVFRESIALSYDLDAMSATTRGVVMGGADGSLHLHTRDPRCPLPSLGRIPRQIVDADDGFFVVAKNVLEFNYLKYTPGRVYRIRTDPPKDCRKN